MIIKYMKEEEEDNFSFFSYNNMTMKKILSINLIIIIISSVFSFLLIEYFSKESEKILMPLAKIKVEKIISTIINHATDNLEHKNLYTLDIDNEEIKMINYNNKEVVKLLDAITFSIEENLKAVEENKSNLSVTKNILNEEIPFGIIFNNTFLSNLGPKIKIKFHFNGNIVSKVETEIKPYGINNAYVEMRIYVSVNGRIILPFVSEEVTIQNVIPISINIVSGRVPEAYITSYK